MDARSASPTSPVTFWACPPPHLYLYGCHITCLTFEPHLHSLLGSFPQGIWTITTYTTASNVGSPNPHHPVALEWSHTCSSWVVRGTDKLEVKSCSSLPPGNSHVIILRLVSQVGLAQSGPVYLIGDLRIYKSYMKLNERPYILPIMLIEWWQLCQDIA